MMVKKHIMFDIRRFFCILTITEWQADKRFYIKVHTLKRPQTDANPWKIYIGHVGLEWLIAVPG